MNRRLILLNVALVALGAWLAWSLHARGAETHAHERAVIEQAARSRGAGVLPPPATPPVKPVTPGDYIDVAQKDLFAKDRNPTVVVDAPPPAPPPPPMPALPSYYGQMSLGDPMIVLAAANTPQKSYRAGDKIGPFEIVSFDTEKIQFKWNDKTVDRTLADLAPKEPYDAARGAQTEAQSPAEKAAQLRAQAKSVGTTYDPAKPDTKIGADMGAGFRGCAAGDTSPAGTVVNGYKKVVSASLMGQSCYWESLNK